MQLRARAGGNQHGFNMTRLALHGARHVNGVSRDPRRASRRTCAPTTWPDVPAAENPVGYVTNGVHVPTFLAQHLGVAFSTRKSAPTGASGSSELDFWQGAGAVPDPVYWADGAGRQDRACSTGVRERLRREYAAQGT